MTIGRPILTSRFRAMLLGIRRIVGMPDYAAYCAHLQRAHPASAMPSEREYFDTYLKDRYESGPTRCC